jgi:hypothetical protein
MLLGGNEFTKREDIYPSHEETLRIRTGETGSVAIGQA